MSEPADPRAAFITAAVGHGDLAEAEALLAAGAATAGVLHPSGYAEVDALIRGAL